MKRSHINEILREGDTFIRSFGYVMPPFAYLSPNELKTTDHSQIKARRMAGTSPIMAQKSLMNWGYFCSPPVMD